MSNFSTVLLIFLWALSLDIRVARTQVHQNFRKILSGQVISETYLLPEGRQRCSGTLRCTLINCAQLCARNVHCRSLGYRRKSRECFHYGFLASDPAARASAVSDEGWATWEKTVPASPATTAEATTITTSAPTTQIPVTTTTTSATTATTTTEETTTTPAAETTTTTAEPTTEPTTTATTTEETTTTPAAETTTTTAEPTTKPTTTATTTEVTTTPAAETTTTTAEPTTEPTTTATTTEETTTTPAAATTTTTAEPTTEPRTTPIPEWLGSACTTDADCTVTDAECFVGSLCLCKAGLFYSVSTKSCLAECSPGNLQATYTRYPTGGFEEFGTDMGKVNSPEKCTAHCTADSACLSAQGWFYLNKPICYLYYVNPGPESTLTWLLEWDGWDTYFKNCA